MPRGAVLAGLVVAGLVVGAFAPVGTAGASGHQSDAFVVALQEDGAATVSLELAFDLTTERDRATFAELEANATRLAQLREAFDRRLSAVAATAAADTGREMRVENATGTVVTDDDAGRVVLSATWTGLARTDGDRLVLAAPFDAAFEPDRQFVVRAPDGYTLSATDPAPASTSDGAATWAADTSLDGFEVVAAPAATGGSGPGFGAVAAVLAISAAAVLTGRRRRRS